MESTWECRDNGEGVSYIERGTGMTTERFLSVPLPYADAEKVETLLELLEKAATDIGLCSGSCGLHWQELAPYSRTKGEG